MKSKRLAVIAASLKCTDEVKVVLRGTPRSWTLRTRGNAVFWVCRRERRRKERRPHYPDQAQAEEREEKMQLNWDRGNTIFTSSAKKKAK